MLAILFSHMYEDVGYLVPHETNDSTDVRVEPGIETQLGGSHVRSRYMNAVAGPSCM